MEKIDIEQLRASGYEEDKESRRRFENECLRDNLIFVAAFLAGLGYVVVAHKLAGLVISAIAFCACLFSVLRQYHAPMIDKKTALPMMKFRNAHPDKCVLLELIYVCKERKTYFRRIWFRVGEF